jgi:hypothetical protein
VNNDAQQDEVRARRQAAAEKYKPERIRLLLVAEAPPSTSHRYFYFDQVTSHDFLFLSIAEVLLGRKPARTEKADGLTKLRELGTFLIDLKLDPVDGSPLRFCVPDLISRCQALNPERIILIKATVFDAAYQALALAGLPVVNKRIYFPSHHWQTRFFEQFTEALESQEEGCRTGRLTIASI